MIIFDVKPIAKARGVENANQLRELCGFTSPATAYVLWAGEATQLYTAALDKLCAGLECELHEIVRYVPDVANRKKGKKNQNA